MTIAGEARAVRAAPVSRRVLLLTNAPAPYTQSFMEAVRRRGDDGIVVARHHAPDIGRRWSAEDRDTVVTGRPWRDGWSVAHLLWRGNPAHVLLSGNYTSMTDAVRRALTAAAPSASVHFWGERLRPGSPRTAAARRCWFSSPGLDGVFAIGSRAVASYRAVTPSTRVIHVLPYTTASGAGLPHHPHDHPTIGYAGRLLPYKGVDSLLEGAAACSPGERPLVEIAGTGPDEPRLRRLAAHLRIDGSTTWLGDLDQATLARHRQSWWAQAVPSRASEGWGVVVNEALNSGVPVLASGQVHAATDLVRSGVNGRIVDDATTSGGRARDRVAAWHEAIREACDPPTMADRSANARRIAAAFAPDRAAAWLSELLGSMERGGAPASRSFVQEAWDSLS